MEQGSSYSFASDPRAAPASRPKYKDTASLQDASTASVAPNIMHDPRVWRGSTYAGALGGHKHASLAPTNTGGPMLDEGAGGGTGTMRRTRRTGKRGKKSIYDMRPPARQHIEVDLTPYLTEPETQAATEVDVTCQTDEFEERPDTPDYVPKKTGIDASTQIEPDDLFSFDREVEPILEIIVGKTLEQALLEVEEETELQGIETRKVTLLDGKAQERRRIRAMEEEAIAEFEAKERRRRTELDRVRAEATVRRKLACVAAGDNLAALGITCAFEALVREKKFANPLADTVEAEFMPWLLQRVAKRVDQAAVAKQVTEDAIKFSVDTSRDRLQQLLDERAAAAAAAAAEAERERMMYVRVFVKVVRGDEEVTAGPIKVKRDGTVGEVEAAVQAWMKANPLGDGFELPDAGLNLQYGGSALDRERSLMEQALPDDAQLNLALDEDA